MKDKIAFEKVYNCLDDECKFIIDAEVSTSELTKKEMPLTRRQIVFKEIQSISENEVEGYISTRDLDWSGDIVIPEGVILDVYKLNPIVLWKHNDANPPIAKCTQLMVDEYGIKARVEFAGTKEAQDFKMLAKNGFLNAFSIGFFPVAAYKKNTNKYNELNAILKSKYQEYEGDAERIISKWVLLEFSLVGQPDNPNALITRKNIEELGIETKTLDMLGLKCKDCEEAKKEFKQALEEKHIEKEINVIKKVDKTIKVVKTIEDKQKDKLIEQKTLKLERELKELEDKLTKKGVLVRY